MVETAHNGLTHHEFVVGSFLLDCVGRLPVLLEAQRLVSPHDMLYDFLKRRGFRVFQLHLVFVVEPWVLFDFLGVEWGEEFEEFFAHEVAVAEVESFEGEGLHLLLDFELAVLFLEGFEF